MTPRAGLETRHGLGLLFVAVFGVYLNALGNGLVDFDDTVVLHPAGAFGAAGVKRLAEDLRANPLQALPQLLVSRPLTGLSHQLDVALFAQDYWGHHLSNVAYHFLACCFAFLAAAELLGSRSAGLAAALVFALHPAQSESVAYLAGRRDVLCGLLSLASLHLWLRALNTERRAAAAGAVALWALAMTAKPAAIILPLLWLAAAATAKPKEFKEHLARSGRLYLGCAAVGLAAVIAHALMEMAGSQRHRLPAEMFWHGGSAAAQWATEPRILLHALKLIVWPATLSADYSGQVFALSRSFMEPTALLALAACASLAGLAWTLRARRPRESFALAWILLAYAPMLHLLPAEHNQEVFAEHWLYLPLFGWALLAAGLRENLRRFPKSAAVGFGVLLFLYAGRTVLRNRDWKDALTLWSQTAATYPRCGRAQGILGYVHIQRGDMAAAEPPLLRALELRPDDYKHHLNLAAVYRNTGRFKEAEHTLLQARGLPRARLAREDIDYNLGLTYLMSGQLQKASQLFHFGPNFTDGLKHEGSLIFNLAGQVAASLGYAPMAESLYARALFRSRDPSATLYNLGFLHYTQRRFELAAFWFERLLKREPSRLQARIYLGLSYAQAGEMSQARRTLDKALRAAPRSVEVWLAVSSFHLTRKDLPQALAAARQAARLEKSPRTERQLYVVYRES